MAAWLWQLLRARWRLPTALAALLLAPARGSEAEGSVEALRAWLASRGGEVSPLVRARSSRDRGKELVADEDIPPGEEIIRVPMSAAITQKAAVFQSALAAKVSALWRAPERPRIRLPQIAAKAFWEEQLTELRENAKEEQVVLATFLLEQWERGDASEYAAWMKAMPRRYASCPAVWSSSEVDCLEPLDEADIVRKKQGRWLDEFLTVVKHVPEMRSFSFADFSHARAAVESRTHGVNLLGEEQTSLVPFADLLNHNQTWRALWTAQPPRAEGSSMAQDGSSFRVVLPQGALAGSLVLTSYGESKSHRDLFLLYGFADRFAPRAASLTLEMPRHDPHSLSRRALAVELGVYKAYYVQSVPPAMQEKDFADLLVFLRILTAEPEALDSSSPSALAAVPAPLALRVLARAAAGMEGQLRGARPQADPSEATEVCLAYRGHVAEIFQGVRAFADSSDAGPGVPEIVAASLRALLAVAEGSEAGAARAAHEL